MDARNELPDYCKRNRAHWDDIAAQYLEPGRRSWSTPYDWVTIDWARKWPGEEAWRARKR